MISSAFTADKSHLLPANWNGPQGLDPITHQPHGAHASQQDSAYESTSHASYASHQGEPRSMDAVSEYNHNKAKAHHPADWASNGDKVQYVSSYKSTFQPGRSGGGGGGGGMMAAAPAKIPPIPRTYVGQSSTRHEEYVAEHRAYVTPSFGYPDETMHSTSLHRAPLDPIAYGRGNAREHSATAYMGSSAYGEDVPAATEAGVGAAQGYNILNGAQMPEYARSRQPGTFFAGRVSAAKIEAKMNARAPGYDIITHTGTSDDYVPRHVATRGGPAGPGGVSSTRPW
ncbi:hypothetical protein BC828DRAFT_374929 [Blastocladiella britannica]|nr:hypothetical protein BC828DRAFT_374929 [Blastocladiella britannica]